MERHYLLYGVNGVVGLLLGIFLYREFHEGFLVVIRGQVYSLKWVVIPLLMVAAVVNFYWFYQVRQLHQDLLLLLLIFSGMVAPFLWLALLVVLRFLLVDVFMGFLAEVSDSFSGLRKELEGWLQRRDIEGIYHHDHAMDKIRQVRRQWSERMVSRKDAVKEIRQLKKRTPSATVKKKRKRKGGKKPAEYGQAGMSDLMSGFMDRIRGEDEHKK